MLNKKLITVFACLIIISLLCLTNVIQSQELSKEGRYYVAEITKSFKVGKTGTLRVFEVKGDVTVQSWPKNEVYINEIKKMDVFTEKEAKTVLEKTQTSYRQEGNVIEVGGEYYNRDWIKSTFKIKVPAGFDLDVNTDGGDVLVADINGTIKLRTSGGDISLENIGGEVDATTSGGDISVTNSKLDVRLKTSGGDLELTNIGGALIAKTSGGDIELKGSKGNVELHTSGGDIEISSAGGEVKAHTSGGDIEVAGTKGDVEVNTSGGDLDLSDIGGSLEASTSGGDITGRNIKTFAHVSTAGGTIELNDVKGGVDAKTAGGNIDVEITLTDFSIPHGVDLQTSGGEITLVIPEKMPAHIRAEIELSGRWDDYNIFSDFPLTSSEDENPENRDRRWRKRYIVSEGDINGGGDLIKLFTVNGNINIKKLRK